MRVLIITHTLEKKSGWGRYSTDVISALIENDVEIVVICNKVNKDFPNIKQFAILPEPFLFRRNYLGVIFYFIKFLKIRKKIGSVNIVHCFVEPYAFFTFFVSWILRARYVITIHGSFGVKSFYNSLYKLIQIFSYENAYKIICISNYTKNRVTQYVKLNNIEIIPNGIDIKQFNSLEELTQTKEDTILGVGGLKERKGFDIVIKAVNLVKKDIPGIKYYIVGTQEDKKYFSYLSGLIKKNGLEDNISFLKEISDSKLKELYRRSKILVLTPVSSKYNFEGFGLTYLEANASGLPVIGSYDNGGEDAIKYGYNGFLTKPRDERDIAEKIVTLLKNDGLYSNMVKNSEKWAKSFLWKDIVKKYINMYEKSNSTR